MGSRLVTIVPVVAVVGAGVLALLRPGSASSTRTTDSPGVAEAPAVAQPMAAGEEPLDPHGALPPNHPPIGGMTAPHGPMVPDQAGGLPPNHPPVGAMNAAHGAMGPTGSDEAPAIRWQVPGGWVTAPNPNPMRIATYKVPAAARGTDDAEMTVARAGGTTEANIQRWLGQFDDAGPDRRTDTTVRGLKVTIVEVTGTYLGSGMVAGAPPTPHPRWSLLAAIVETSGSPYFFKLVGPEATVHAARAGFDSLVNSCTPS